MALTNCPQCGKQISEKAQVCPNCGIEIDNLQNLDSEKVKKKVNSKRKNIQIGSTIGVLVIIVLFLGIQLSKVKIKESAISLGCNDTVDLNVDGWFLSWSTSNSSVAKVENGTVIGCGNGEAVITAKTLFGTTDTIKVTVASIIGEWEYDRTTAAGKDYLYNSLGVSIDVAGKYIFLNVENSGETFNGKWKFMRSDEEEGIDVYKFETDSTFDFDIMIKEDYMCVAPEGASSTIAFFFSRY